MTVLVQSLPSQAGPASELAAALGTPFEPVALHAFPDGELLPRVSSADTVIAYVSLHPANPTLMALLLAADAWRRAGARRLVLVAPYLCYMRQDAVFTPGEPLSRDVVGGLLRPRFDRFLTVQAHLHRTPGIRAIFGRRRAQDLSAAGPLAAALAGGPPPLVVAPDIEATPWARGLAKLMGGDHLTLSKARRGDREVETALAAGGRAAGRRVILTDDVVSTGETLIAAAGLMNAAGAATVEAAVAHAMFGAAADRRMREAGIGRVVSTDSVRHPSNAAPLAPLLAAALEDEMKR